RRARPPWGGRWPTGCWRGARRRSSPPARSRGRSVSGEGATVVFVGAGPGEVGLVTLRGQQALAEAQAVVFDAGLPASLLDLATDGTERIPVAGSPDDGQGGVPRAAVPA